MLGGIHYIELQALLVLEVRSTVYGLDLVVCTKMTDCSRVLVVIELQRCIVRHPHYNTTRGNADFVSVRCLGTAIAARCGPVM